MRRFISPPAVNFYDTSYISTWLNEGTAKRLLLGGVAHTHTQIPDPGPVRCQSGLTVILIPLPSSHRAPFFLMVEASRFFEREEIPSKIIILMSLPNQTTQEQAT